MRTNLALANILNNVPKTALSLAGIGIAIVLIFMQLGFRGAVEDTAINIYRKLDFDLLIRSPNYLHFVDSGRFHRDALNEIAGIEHVQSVNTVNVGTAPWRTVNVGTAPWRNELGEYKGVLMLAIDPSNSPIQDPSINQQLDQLNAIDAMLVDNKSHREFGPLDGRRFRDEDLGREIPVSNQMMRITGIFSMGAGLAANGLIIVSQSTFQRLRPTFGPQHFSFGLVKLQPGQSREEMARALAQRFQVAGITESNGDLATSVEVLTRDEVMRRELNRWMNETPIGFIFTLGVMIAFLVGAAIVYMVLGNDVANRLHEYATLRAMGYSNKFLAAVVMRQATYLAIFSFVPALLLSFFLYWLTSTLAGLGLEMNWQRILFVLGLTFLMCIGSGTLALRKLWHVAPADLY